MTADRDAKIRRPIFILRLRAEPQVTDPVRALRRALKILLRRFGLRAVSVGTEGAQMTTARGFAAKLDPLAVFEARAEARAYLWRAFVFDPARSC